MLTQEAWAQRAARFQSIRVFDDSINCWQSLNYVWKYSIINKSNQKRNWKLHLCIVSYHYFIFPCCFGQWDTFETQWQQSLHFDLAALFLYCVWRHRHEGFAYCQAIAISVRGVWKKMKSATGVQADDLASKIIWGDGRNKVDCITWGGEQPGAAVFTAVRDQTEEGIDGKLFLVVLLLQLFFCYCMPDLYLVGDGIVKNSMQIALDDSLAWKITP